VPPTLQQSDLEIGEIGLVTYVLTAESGYDVAPRQLGCPSIGGQGEHMGWISKLRRNRDRGANLVEFALIAPLLVLLLLGIVELGWGLAQHIDVRHKARETLRLAIVDEPLSEIEARACIDDIVKSDNIQNISLTTGTTEGEPISVTVTADLQMLTGLFGVFFGSTPQISSTVEGRVEQDSSFPPSQELAPCP